MTILLLAAMLCAVNARANISAEGIRWSYPVFLDRFQTAGPRAYAGEGPVGARLLLDHTEFLPGQRRLEFWFDRGDDVDEAPLEIIARLLDPVTDEEWAAASCRLASRRVFGEVDADVLRGDQGLLDITIARDGAAMARHRVILSRSTVTPAPLPVAGIELRLDFPGELDSEQEYPFTLGVPFAAGQWWGVGDWRLRTADGADVSHQTEITATWFPDGAVKWLRVDGVSRPVERLYLQHVDDPPLPAAGMAQPEGDGMVVDTGAARWIIGSHGALLESWIYGGIERRFEDIPGLHVIDQNGRVGTASAEGAELRVEQNAPRAASIRVAGAYRTAEGEELARHVTRFEFQHGWHGVKITHTLVLTRDTNEIWFREVGWNLKHAQAATDSEELTIHAGMFYEDMRRGMEFKPGSGETIALAQTDHVQFHGGTDLRQIISMRNDAEQVLEEQAGEIGGWLAWAPARTPGLLVHCRRAARLHPKELAGDESGLILKLFAPRGGTELDFRIPALLERWNRGGMLDTPANRKRVEEIRKLESNAVGWSRTHEILLMPFNAGMPAPAIEQVAAFEDRVYGLAAPDWLAASSAMGPFSPKDKQRFPEVEERIENAWARWETGGYEQMQDYGFVDYFAGPHYRGQMGQVRQRLDYGSRLASWRLYARSGERALGAFAEGTHLSYMDIYMAHADGPRKIAGVPLGAAGTMYDRFPFHWERATRVDNMSVNRFLYFYYLMGSRRARDVVETLSTGMRRWLATEPPIWRRLGNIMAPQRLYHYNWDEHMRDVLEQYIQFEYLSEGYLGRTMNAAYNTAYKMRSCNSRLVEAWQATRDPRLYDMCRRISPHTWQAFIGGSASRYTRGLVANFLVADGWHADMVLESLALGVRMLCADERNPTSWSIAYLDLPYALPLLEQYKADQRPYASYAGALSHGEPLQVVFRKGAREVRLFCTGAADAQIDVAPQTARRNSRLYSINRARRNITAHIPMDDNAGIYRLQLQPLKSSLASSDLSVAGEGQYGIFVVADSRLPLVVFAPAGWQPAPGTRELPRLPIYFHVPAGSPAPALHTAGRLRLWTPQGEPYPTIEPVGGNVELPSDQPGLWRMEIDMDGLITVDGGIPPVFALRDPQAWFNPLEDWPELFATGAADNDNQDEED